MGVLDRITERGRLSGSSTQEQEAEEPFEYPDVIRRAKAMMQYHMDSLTTDTRPSVRRAAVVFNKLFAEAMDEAAEAPPEFIEDMLRRGAAMFYWAATGQNVMNMPVPGDFYPFIEKNHPDLMTGPVDDQISTGADRYREIEVKPAS